MSRYLFYTKNGELLLPLEGLSVDRCVIDHAFSLEVLCDGGTVVLRVEGPFTLTENDEPRFLDPNEPAKLGAAVALVHGSVRRARASVEGRLSIAFDDGRELTVEPSEDFEAWEFSGPKGIKAVCRVGGGISTWGASE